MPTRTPIPRLTKTGNGFGGFAVNPSIPYPGGRLLVSDVEDAANALNFGGTSTQRFNPAPTPGPTATPQPGDNSNAGLVSSTLRDFNDADRFPRSYYKDATNSGEIGIDAGADQFTGRGRPPSLITDPNEDWIGTPSSAGGPRTDGLPTDPGPDEGPGLFPTQQQPDMVTLYKGAPGDHGAPVWWDTSNQGSNRIGPQPWWVTFNPNIGNNLFTSATDLGIGTRPPAANISGGGPSTVPEPDWMKDYATVAPFDSTPAPDRSDPSFVDPGSGLEPDPSTTTSTTSTRNNTNTGGGTGTGGSTAPPVGTHYDFTRGTYVDNDYAGGAQFSSQADDLMTMWDQSRFQPTNRQVAPDSGRDTFAPGSAGVLDSETGILRRVQSPKSFAFSMSQKPGAPTLRLGDPKSTAAYNSWVMRQPEWKAFMQRMLGAGATPSFQTGGGPTPRSGSGGE